MLDKNSTDVSLKKTPRTGRWYGACVADKTAFHGWARRSGYRFLVESAGRG
jgi:hypothetical protein